MVTFEDDKLVVLCHWEDKEERRGVETQTVVIESAQCSCSSSGWSGSIRAGGKLYSIVAIHHNPTPVAIKQSRAIEYLHSHLIAPLSLEDIMVIASIWRYLKLSLFLIRSRSVMFAWIFESVIRFCCIYCSGKSLYVSLHVSATGSCRIMAAAGSQCGSPPGQC